MTTPARQCPQCLSPTDEPGDCLPCRHSEEGYADGANGRSRKVDGDQTLKDFGATCRERSGKAFADRDENRAYFLRELADELDKLSEEKRRQQKSAQRETAKWGEPIDLDGPGDPLAAVMNASGLSAKEVAALVDGEDVTVTLTAAELRAIYGVSAGKG